MQGAENRKPGVQIYAERRCHIYPNFPLQNKPQTDISFVLLQTNTLQNSHI